MSYVVKKLEKSQVEFTFTIVPADYKKEMEHAAEHLAQRAAIKGFRPGKAPYEIVKQQLGEQKIMEEMAEHIVQHTFFDAVKAEKLETVSMPKISIQKMAPGNDFVYVAVAALLPEVKLADLAQIKVTRKPKKVGEKDVNEALEHLRKMQPKEVIKTGKATKEDKVVIDMDMFIEKVPVEGGQAKGHQVYLSEPHYIPGLAEKLVGLAKAETAEFTLKFPKEHYQKHLAGKDVDFKIKVNEVFELQYANLDDEFAKSLGQESLEKMKELLLNNIAREAENKEDQRVEAEILEQLIAKSTFSEIPDVMIDSEKQKMFYELKHDLEHRGLDMTQYLANIKKTEEEIFKDFTQGGTKRAQAALISRQLAIDHNIKVEKDELEKEIALIRATYPDNKQVEENLKRPEVIDTIAASVQNRKVMEMLVEKVVGAKAEKTDAGKK